jgi:hypothetical protein
MNNDEMNERERQVMSMAAGLARDVQPPRDLWPGIAEAINSSPVSRAAPAPRWQRMFAQAAAIVLLIGGSSGLTWYTLSNSDTSLVTPGDHSNLNFEPVSGSFGSQYMLGPDFQDARESLVAKLDEELERLPPETREEVEKNIATIRAAISEINKALAQEPDSVLLQELLLNTYSEELAIMRKVDGLAHTVMRRTDI